VVDNHFQDPYLVSLYDLLCPWDRSYEFYLGLVRSAPAVLDVGCGTGALLAHARGAGHRGRLVGLDPAQGMLIRARAGTPDIEWRCGYLPDAGYDAEFDLIVMTGHAFQVLLTDEEIHAHLEAIHRALVAGGHFAFDTRNPRVAPWSAWTPDDVTEVIDDAGNVVRVCSEVQAVDGEFVDFVQRYAGSGSLLQTSRTRLRFLPAEAVDALLTRAGFVVDERYGDWDRSPFTPASREIITVARHAPVV
jgi:SAM-dependent methyltransferase